MDAARIARPDDVDAVTSLARAAVAELADLRGGPLWRRHAGRQEPIEDGVATDLAMGPSEGVAVVGTVDDAVIGYGVSHLEDLADGSRLSVVTDLYVHPDARGIGVGEAMVGLLIDHATAAGAVGIDSLALPGDRATKNFFETFGLKARAIIVHRALDGPSSQEPRSDDDGS